MSSVQQNNLINGVFSDYLTVNDRAIHYGDGLFETILCHGDKLYYWLQHFQRLQASAEKLNIDCPPQRLLLDDIARLLETNRSAIEPVNETACAIKIILSRGAGERGYRFSKKMATNRVVLLADLKTDYSSLLSNKLLEGKLFLCEQQVSINKNLAGHKHLNRLENVLARNEWGNDHIDGLMLNANQHVIEGTMSNLFAVKNKQLFTPELDLSGVNGIMRDRIIASAQKHKIDVIVKDLSVDALYVMDELFISNSLIGMKAVTRLSDTSYNQRHVANIIFNDLLNTMEDYAQTI